MYISVPSGRMFAAIKFVKHKFQEKNSFELQQKTINSETYANTKEQIRFQRPKYLYRS
jgi:hypothetical protein